MNIQHQSSSISFENKIEFLSVGTHLSSNLCLEDVDSDGNYELIVCEWISKELKDYGEADVENSLGTISILKFMNIWRFAEFNGMVTCVGVGNVSQPNQNLIVICCADAYCYLFDVHSIDKSKTASSGKSDPSYGVMSTWHKQRFPSNAKDMVVVDIDKDGLCEVIVAHSDRTVRMFKWDPNVEEFPNGAFVQMMVWELSGQIGSISMHYSPSKGDQIMASQPGGSYVVLNQECAPGRPTLTYYPLDRKKATNVDVRTEILGNIRRCRIKNNSSSSHMDVGDKVSDSNHYFAISSLDGTIQLHDENQVIFDFQMDRNRELFGLCKVDLTGDSSEEVVVSSWDGVTIILNDKRQVVRFHSGAPCQAFTAGYYAVSPGKNQSVLVYTTFNNRTVMYYNMSFTKIPCISVKHLVKTTFEEKLKQKGIDVNKGNQFRWAVRWLLYESSKKN